VWLWRFGGGSGDWRGRSLGFAGFTPKKPNRTKPKSVDLNQYPVQFGFEYIKKKKTIWLVFLFKTKPNRNN
jgi:hypothetical protein